MIHPPLLYVAGKYAGNIRKNINKAERVSISLIRNGWYVFTPHKNTAGYEQYENNNITKNTWIQMDLDMLNRCDALYVMDNWRTSSGTKNKIEYAIKLGMPIFWEESSPCDNFKVMEFIK